MKQVRGGACSTVRTSLLLLGGVCAWRGFCGRLKAAEPSLRGKNTTDSHGPNAYAHILSDGMWQRIKRLIISTSKSQALAFLWLWLGACLVSILLSPIYSFTLLF